MPMRNTWLVKASNTKLAALTELYYYLLFFSNHSHLFVSPSNALWLRYYQKLSPLRDVFNRMTDYNFTTSASHINHIHKFFYFNADFFFKSIANERFLSHPSKIIYPTRSNFFKNKQLFSLFYNLFFLINYAPIGFQFSNYHSFYLFGIQPISRHVFIMNASKFFKR
jgi:hypothetical protein